MKKRVLRQISIVTTSEAEDAVAALMERVLGQCPSVYANAENKTSTATVYVHKPLTVALRKDLARGLDQIATCGLDARPARILSRPVRREDWSESWKKYFKAIEIGSKLLILPSWSRRRPRRGQALVVLDPGLSFGTGQHPTTSFCLHQLVVARGEGTAQSFLDIGTGSGILAIAAAKLGYEPVRAFDFDPVAVRVARANAKRNRVDHRIGIQRRDLAKLRIASRTKYHVLCANLTDDLLIAHAEMIRSRLQPGGRLVLAGVLASQFGKVKSAYDALGLRLIATRIEREWQSAAFRWALR